MSGTGKVLAGIADLAEQVLPMIDSSRGAAAAGALEALRRLVRDASALAATPDEVASLEALGRKVGAHCDETLARLRSTG
jgi:hypothetical protein